MSSNQRHLKPVSPQKNSNKRNSSSGKENDVMALRKISSGRKVEQLMSDMRISACKTITNVKFSIGDISQRLLRQSTRIKSQKFPKSKQYQELNEKVTPVKLYSPFTFVTPSPVKGTRKRSSPRRFSFSSPTGKFQNDVKQLTKENKERERIEKSLFHRRY